MKRFLLIVFGVVAAIAVIFLLYVFLLKQPQADKPWREDLARFPRATELSNGLVEMHDVRDYAYASSTIVEKSWRTLTVDPSKITRAWFLVEPFPGWGAVGHTYLTFDFSDGTSLSFSIEARLKEGQPYSAWKGLWNSYELMYTWGTERDFLARRLLFLHHTVRMYPLAVSPETAQDLFMSLINATNTLAEHPRFYNTLTENCTNTLAYIVNSTNEGTLPWDLSWYLTGLSDRYLMKEGFIATLGSIGKTQDRYDLSPHVEVIESLSSAPAETFTSALRAVIKAP